MEIHLAVKFGCGRRFGGHQVHRTRLRDQPGVGLNDDDEVEGEKPRGSDGNASRISHLVTEEKTEAAKALGDLRVLRESEDFRSE